MAPYSSSAVVSLAAKLQALARCLHPSDRMLTHRLTSEDSA